VPVKADVEACPARVKHPLVLIDDLDGSINPFSAIHYLKGTRPLGLRGRCWADRNHGTLSLTAGSVGDELACFGTWMNRLIYSMKTKPMRFANEHFNKDCQPSLL
jgi:hypothetical protein